MPITWPAQLPQELFVGLTDRREPAVVRTKMDAGPAKVRRRFSVAVRTVSTPVILTGTERSTFETFFAGTLKEGSLSFDWTDPLDDGTVSYRFVNPPEFTLVKGGTSSDRLWQGSFEMEILP